MDLRIDPCPLCGRAHDYLVEADTVARMSMPSAAVCQSPRPVMVVVDFTCPGTGGEFTHEVEFASPSGLSITWTGATPVPQDATGDR